MDVPRGDSADVCVPVLSGNYPDVLPEQNVPQRHQRDDDISLRPHFEVRSVHLHSDFSLSVSSWIQPPFLRSGSLGFDYIFGYNFWRLLLRFWRYH